ncbi:MAG TPA: hypothetical protein VGK23_12960 [Methanomassiliicoccales archaeon]
MLGIAKAFVFATGMYGLLFTIYVVFRLTFNPDIVHLDDLFIDYIPYFTFYITGLLMFAVFLVSICLYAVIGHFSRSKQGPKGIVRFQGFWKWISKRPDGTKSRSVLIGQLVSERLGIIGLLALIIWLISTSVWAYNCYLVVSNPIGYFTMPHALTALRWPTAITMFVISFFSMMVLHYRVSQQHK